jgi:hypothetical protein
LRRSSFGVAALAAGALLLGSCGGGSSNTSSAPPTTSRLTKRAFVSNEFTGRVQIVNAATDTLSGFSFASGSGAQTMVVSGNKAFTFIFTATNNTLVRANNATEVGLTATALLDYSDSVAASSDGTKAYAAIRNALSSTGTPLGVVAFVDYTGASPVVTTVDVPLARRLVLSPDGAKLLVFSDDPTVNSVFVIDTATKVRTEVPSFDRPVWGVFSSDSSKAYIMNCGPECGGTAAGVVQLDMTSNTPGAPVPVSAATVGLLDGTNLYVAGTVSAGTGGGCLTVLTTSGLAVTTPCVPINDGYHTTMAISNNHVFVGARACSNVAEGCLSIYSGGSAVIGTPKGEVTGMQAISGRMIVYVCEGGELRIYDSSTSMEKLPAPVDIVGKAWDVKTVD